MHELEKKEYKNLIDGRWIDSITGEIFESHNPANIDHVIGSYQRSGPEDVECAIKIAEKAFERWASLPAPKRGEILFKAARIIEERKNELALLLTSEEGKILSEAKGELSRAARIFEYFGGEGARLFGQVIPSERRQVFAMTIRRALGVVSLITPWNFPAAIPAWKIAPALVSGNCVIIKPSSLAPALCIRLCEALVKAGIPEGVLNLITGFGNDIGKSMVTNPAVRAVSFTGSSAVGDKIKNLTAEKAMRTQLEMGGVNPTIVLKDADLELAADITANAAFSGTGQKCTATSRAIVEKPVLKEFTNLIVKKVNAIKVGNPLEQDTQMGPVINEEQLKIILRHIEIAKSDGAKLLCGGERLSGGAYDKGYYIAPTLFGDVDPEMQIAREEVFGPVLSIISANDFDDAIRISNSVRYGLSASLCTENISNLFNYLNSIDAGVIMVNIPSAGVEYQLPFGGVKSSSMGLREQGPVAVDFYTELRTVYIKF